MDAVISLTENGERNFNHAVICARRSVDASDIDRVVLLARGSGVELADEGSSHREDAESLMNDGVDITVSQPCVDARDLTMIDGVESVSSGAVELLRIQSNGYNVVKIP